MAAYNFSILKYQHSWYISNAIFSLWLDARNDNIVRDIFKDVENYDHVLQLAIKIGYIAQRYEGKISVEEMFANVRPLR